MKNVFKRGFFYFVVLATVFGNSILSIDFSIPIANAITIENPQLVSGNPTCQDLGYDNEYKIDPPSDGTYTTDEGNITLTNTGTGQFNWSSTFGIEAVIAKGGPKANVYRYNPEATSGTSLVTPNNPSGGPADLSHASFCYNDPVDCQLVVTKEHEYDGDPVAPGDQITYSLSITNNGTEACSAVRLKDFFDSNTTYVTADPVPYNANDYEDYLGWSYSTIAAGESHQVSLTMEVKEDTCGVTIENMAKSLSQELGWTDPVTVETTVVCEENSNATVKAAKVVCMTEEDLPNWGNGSTGPSQITDTTAIDYVDNSQGRCWLEEDWAFQWGIDVADPGNDFIGEAGSGWNNFDSTTGDGIMAEAVVDVDDVSTIKIREVLPAGYIPFAWDQADGGDGTANNVSAEIYCYNDIYNYDNYDFINGPQPDTTYYCVAFNVGPYCGDNHLDEGEQCDDGNNEDYDGCSATCTIEKPQIDCGNEKIEEGEQCDDGNQEDGDGCTANCTLENTYECEDITSKNGWYGQYFNYLAEHPDMDLPSGQWPDADHGDPLGSWDTDWYDSQYFRFNRVDDNLMFGGAFFPMDFAAEESHNGHDYHFGIHWRAEVTPQTAGNYEFTATSDDDLWVYLDGVLIAENSGIHAPSTINNQMYLSGSHIIDIFFAERHVTQSHMSFEFADETLDIVPMPEECTICGNGIVEGDEECDAGLNGSFTCTSECTLIEQPPICYVEGEPFFASTVESYDQGQKKDGSNVDANRSIPEQGLVLELGQNVSNFFSLGFGGWIIASFDDVFVDGPGNDIKITEDTWGGNYPLEKADVYVSQNGTDWVFLGTADNTNLNVIHTISEFDLATTGLTWGQYIKVVDTTDPNIHSASADGYDLNAIEALSGGYIGECKDVITVCKMDEQENPLAGWEMTLYGSNLIVNGGFEVPALSSSSSSGSWAIYPDASLTSWTVNSGAGLEIQNNAAGAPHSGNQLAELDSHNSSVVSQIITTMPGQEYHFSFWYSPRPGNGVGDNTIGVSVQGIGDGGFLVSDTIGATAVGGSNTSWTLYEYSFTATQASTEIKFADLGNDRLSYGGYLDDVVLKQIVSGLTEENGCVEFVDLPYDVYQIMETLKDGWTQVEPAESNYFTVDFNEENDNPTVTFVNKYDGGGEEENTPPVITLVGNNPVEVIQGNSYNDAGATAYDNEDGDITDDIVTNNPVNTSILGTYIVTYNVEDSEGSSADEVTRTVNVVPGQSTPYCGDGTVNQTSEQCDGSEPQSCTTGAGYAGTQTCNMPGEQSEDVQYCIWNECVSEYYCGDGLLNAPEQCDDGNTNSGDGCSASCTTETTTTRGGGGGGGIDFRFAIKDLNDHVSCSGVELSWLTTKTSDTIIDYGTASGVYTVNVNNDTNATAHSITLKNLLPNTTYYYRVKAINGSQAITVVEKSFTTLPAEQCGQVLGEKIQNIACNFLRASGSSGPDTNIEGVWQFPNGSLLRDACDPVESVYLIKDQMKWHVPNWQYLHDNHFGQRIYNVLSEVINSYPNWQAKVLGVKTYADGTLLRSPDMKIYILENGQKRHIKTFEELFKYAGQEIINVSYDVLNQY